VPKKIKKQRAEGYADGEVMLYRRLNASEFVASKDYLDLLSRCNEVCCHESGSIYMGFLQVVIDDDTYESHEWTTDEVKHCLSDIKVCGPRELRTILNWRKKIIEFNRKKQL
jgi:AdoMet-dependent rRNA methyltransferase SPB1